MKGKGAWIIMYKVTHRGKKRTVRSHLYPVYYLPGLTHRLLSVGHMLNNGFKLKDSSSLFEFSAKTASTKWLLV
jgi:hypothetical protein